MQRSIIQLTSVFEVPIQMTEPPIILVIAASWSHFEVCRRTEWGSYDPRLFRYISHPDDLYGCSPEHTRLVLVWGDLHLIKSQSLRWAIRNYEYKVQVAKERICKDLKAVALAHASRTIRRKLE